VGFNLAGDREELGEEDRMVWINCFDDEENDMQIGFSFPISPKEDSRMNLLFPLEELMTKLVRAIYQTDNT